MTELTTRLVVTADASGLVGEVRTARGAIDELGGTTRQAGEAAEETAGDLDRTRRAADDLGREAREGAGGVDDLGEGLDDLGEAASEAANASEAAEGIDDVGEAAEDSEGGLQNLGFQLQDIFTQVAGGTPIVQSLGQQLPQLLGGLGAIGAIGGAFAAAIIPLGGYLYDLATSAGDAEEDIRSFAEAMEDAEESVDQAHRNMLRSARENMERIREEYGRVTEEILRFERRGEELAKETSIDDALAAGTKVLDEGVFADLDALAERLADIDTRIENVEAGIRREVGPALQGLRAQLMDLQLERIRLETDVEFDLDLSPETFEQFVDLRTTIAEALAAENFDVALVAMDQLVDLARETGGPFAELVEKLNEVGQQLLKARDQAAEVPPTLDEAREAANRLNGILDDVGDVISDALGSMGRMPSVIDDAREATGRWSIALAPIATMLARAAGILTTTPGAPISTQVDNGVFPPAAPGPGEFVVSPDDPGAPRRPGIGFLPAENESIVNPTTPASPGGGGIDTAAREAERAAKEAERERLRVIREIERAMDKLAPSYERDVAAAQAWRDEALATLDSAAEGYDAFASDVETVYNALLKDAYDEDLKRRTDWQAGIVRGLDQIEDKTRDWASVSEALVTSFGQKAEDAFVQFATTGKLQTGDMVDYVLEQLARLAYQSAIDPALNALIGLGTDFLSDVFSGGLGGLFGPGMTTGTPLTTAILPPLPTAHTGSPGVMRSYPGGLAPDEELTVTRLGETVMTAQQMENVGAVVEALAFAARPARETGGRTLVRVEVNNQTSARVEARQTDEGVQIDIMDAIEGEMASRVGTGRGRLAGAIQGTFGLQRSFGGRR